MSFRPTIILRSLLLAAACTLARAESTQPLLPLPSTAARLAPPADPQHFMFAVGGDNRATGRSVPMPPTAGQIFSEFRLLQPAFALWTGDTIYGSEESLGEADAEYRGFLAAAAQAETPIFNAPGNHEISERPERETLYAKRMGRLYGSFDYGRYHFIALDTEEAGQKVGISRAQETWLEADLAANRGAEQIFAFSHHPLFPARPGAGFADSANRDEIHRLFVKYGISCVFGGHEHLYSRSVHDGIIYVVTGGAGAPSEGGPEDGGFQHYLLAYVNGRELTISVIEPWRLFVRVGPVRQDGSCTAQVDNYNGADLSVLVQFPTDSLGSAAVASASLSYKTWSHSLSAAVIPSRTPGTIAVRVTVPRARSAFVAIAPPLP